MVFPNISKKDTINVMAFLCKERLGGYKVL